MRHNQSPLTLTLILNLGLSLSLPAPASAQPSASVPNLVDVQGFLRTQGGQPVNKTVSLKVTLYDASSGGNQLYTETIPLVPVTGGRFSVLLGTMKALPQDIFTTNPKVFVGVAVDASAELPRQQLVTVAFAYKAQLAVNAVSADAASSLDCTSCVGEANLGDGVVTGSKIGVPCTDGQVLKKTSGGWGCGKDDDTKYSGADFAKSNQACGAGLVVNGFGADGTLACVKDADTKYSGADFAKSGQTCGAGLLVNGIGADGALACAPDTDTKYTGADFVKSGQACTQGTVVSGAAADGSLQCVKVEMTAYSAGTGLALDQGKFMLDLTFADGRYVNSGEAGAISKEMIADGAVTAAKLGEPCAKDQILKKTDAGWACAKDEGLVYTGKDFWLSNQLCPVDFVVMGAKADGTIVCVKDVSITYSGKDFVLSDQQCGAGFVVKGASADGTIACVKDDFKVYTGADFALSNQTCPAGFVMAGVAADGKAACQLDDKGADYTAGPGIEVAGGKISLLQTCASGNVLKWNAGSKLWECKADADSLAGLNCSKDQVARWNGSAWECASLTPPKCDGQYQALGWNGNAFVCMDIKKNASSGGNANGMEIADPWGAVWDGFPRAPRTWADANSVCTTLGGRLPTASEVFRNNAASGAGAVGDPTSTYYQWTRTLRDSGNHITIRVSDGLTSYNADSGSISFRCIWPETMSANFDGDHCMGPAGAGCYAKTGGQYSIDMQDRPQLPLWSAIDECAFDNARIPDLRELEEAVRQGLPNGSNNALWTAERYVGGNSGPPIVVYAWSGTAQGFTPSNSWATPGYNGRWPTDFGRFRCIGLKDRSGLKAATGTGFEHPTLKFKVDATDSGPSTYWTALDTCRDAGGGMPDLGELETAIRAGLGQGTLTPVWTGEHFASTNCGPPIVTVSWSNTNTGWFPPNAFVGSNGYNGFWQSTSTINRRCITWPTSTMAEPTCNGNCFKLTKGNVTWWADNFDRSGTYWQGIDACVALGGHVPDLVELQTLIRGGLPNGSNSAVFTSEKYVATNPGPPQITVYWTGTNPAWAAPNCWTSPNGHGGIWPTDTLKYRCVWSNAAK